jgi:hypothetical protein
MFFGGGNFGSGCVTPELCRAFRRQPKRNVRCCATDLFLKPTLCPADGLCEALAWHWLLVGSIPRRHYENKKNIEIIFRLAWLLSAPVANAALCQPGYYSANGQEPGVPAPPGYYVPTNGATELTPAPPGFFAEGYANVAPSAAPAGSYAPIEGMARAVLCPPGYIVPTNGATDVTPVPAGFISPNYGNTAPNTVPPAGYYAPVAGMARGVPAVPGYYVSGLAATNLTPAAPGYFVANAAARTQTPAPLGTFAPCSAMTAPLPALPGYYSPATKSVALQMALPGSFVCTAGATNATPAPPGSIAPISGMSAAIVVGDLNIGFAELNLAISNFWAVNPAFVISNFSRGPGGAGFLQLDGDPTPGFTVLASTNLEDWQPIGQATSGFFFNDDAAADGVPQRYYRLALP